MNNSLAEVHSELVSEWSEENSMKSLLENKLYDWLTTACQLIVLGFLFLFLFTSIPLITSGASLTALYHCISRGHTNFRSHLRASFTAVLLLSVRLMAGHIKETFILLFTMAGACLIVFLVPGLFVLFPRILCGIASHLIEPGLKKALAID